MASPTLSIRSRHCYCCLIYFTCLLVHTAVTAPTADPQLQAQAQPTNHLIRFIGMNNGYADPTAAKEALELNLKKLTGSQKIIIHDLDHNGASWYSDEISAMLDCPESKIRGLYGTIKEEDGSFTRGFKMAMDENFVLPSMVTIDWLGPCENVGRKRSQVDTLTTSTQSSSSSDSESEPSQPTTTIDPPTTAVELDETTTQDPFIKSTTSSLEVESMSGFSTIMEDTIGDSSGFGLTDLESNLTRDPFTSSFFDNDNDETTTNVSATTPTTTNNLSVSDTTTTTTTTSRASSSSGSQLTTTMTTTISATIGPDDKTATTAMPTSTPPVTERSPDSTTTPDVSPVELGTEASPTDEAANSGGEPLESVTSKPDSSPGGVPIEAGKYVGLAAAFLIFVAYLVCSRAYKRQGMYELHNERAI